MKKLDTVTLYLEEVPELGYHIVAETEHVHIKKDESMYSFKESRYKHYMFFPTKDKGQRALDLLNKHWEEITADHIHRSPRWFPYHKDLHWSEIPNPKDKPIFVHAHWRAAYK